MLLVVLVVLATAPVVVMVAAVGLPSSLSCFDGVCCN